MAVLAQRRILKKNKTGIHNPKTPKRMKKFITLILVLTLISCSKSNIGSGFIGEFETPEKPFGIMTISFKNKNPDHEYPFFKIKTQDGETHEGQLVKGVLNLWYWDAQYNLTLDRNGNIKMIKDPNPADVLSTLTKAQIIENEETAKRI